MKRMYCYAACSVFIWLVLGVSGPNAHAAAAGLAAAKKQAVAKGCVFETNHDDIIAKAKQQGGKVRVLSSFDPGSDFPG